MNSFLLDLLQLFFRMVPHPTKPRLIIFGKPDRKSPVLVTANSSLTVRRLSKALRGMDCYLLVAPAGGINVWCGSVGGHFTTESIISIIKTSRIAQYVDHRRLILPQLCAASITSKELHARIGWSAKFGPIRAEDIPTYFRNGCKVTIEMTEVRYSTKDRIEMAMAMSGSIIIRYSIFPLILLGLWGVSRFTVAVFFFSATLHLFNEKIPAENHTHKSFFICALSLIVLAFIGWEAGIGLVTGTISLIAILLGASLLVGTAYSGYTPFKQCSYSKQFYGFKPLKIDIVAEDCTGCTLCDWVCPVDCFETIELTPRKKVFIMAKPSNCVECGACLVQCPTGAVIDLYANLPGKENARCA
jgi:NAD-dependent dihydropyrimidine dehydrogenase PreA subunit